MDDLIEMLLTFMQQLGQSIDDLDDSEMNQVTEFLNEVMGFVTEGIRPTEIPEVEAPIPTGTDLLWILSGGQEDAFINYLRTFPDAGLNSLLKNPDLLRSTIERLNRELPQGERGEEAGIPQSPLESSNIYGFQYDPSSGSLLVRFQSGSVYGYEGVPPGVFRIFQQGAVPAKTTGRNEFGQWWQGKIPSLGAAFYELIRLGGYPYERLA